MSFQSFHFLVFVTTMVIACGLLRQHFGARKNVLLVASYYFYMCWDWRFGGLLAATTLLHFGVALGLAREKRLARRRGLLALSIAGGLGVLAYFKYSNFFVQSAAALARALGFDADPAILAMVLPIGISFYTFQALSYVFDVYRGHQEPTRCWRDFALFVAFFPTVLAGPVTRASQLLAQLSNEQTVPGPEVEQAVGLVIRGFLKKVIFADVLATAFVDPAFANPGAYSPLFLLAAVYAFSFQIYMDVSAYTDIARGAALLCGFRLPQNFDCPYQARTVSSFWQRWHMSVSSFFRDYVFIGLGGSRHGHVYVNLMLTFLAIGLWHGGGWNFLVYGALHGAMVCLERYLRMRRTRLGVLPAKTDSRLRATLQIVFVFNFVAFSRILFRSPDLAVAGQYLAAMTDFGQGAEPFTRLGLFILGLAGVLHWAVPAARIDAIDRFRRLPVSAQALALVCVVYATLAFSSSRAPFVYFNF